LKGLCHYCLVSNLELHIGFKDIIRCEKCKDKIIKDIPKNEPKLLPFQDLPELTPKERELNNQLLQDQHIAAHEESSKNVEDVTLIDTGSD